MTRDAVRLLVVGDELLDGRTREANSAWLIDELVSLSLDVEGVEVLPDELDVIRDGIGRAASRARVVVVTGGLGPTPDDLNRDALAAWLGEEMEEDAGLLATIRERFESRGREMTHSNVRQAFRPPSATAIPNANGTAPGLWVERDGCLVVLMPGVPEEMRTMWREQVRDLVGRRTGMGRGPRVRLRVSRVAESWLADRVRAALAPREVDVAYCVQRYGIDILLRPDTPELERVLTILRTELGERVYAEGSRQLDEVVLDRLRERKQTVAVAESCTGGMLGSMLTDHPGSSDVFLGGSIVYADSAKRERLDVAEDLLREHGAVSEPVALALARGVRKAFGADWGLATTGIAGPGGGTAEKPVGTIWIAVAGADGEEAHLLRLPGDREQNRRWTCVTVLDHLRLRLGS